MEPRSYPWARRWVPRAVESDVADAGKALADWSQPCLVLPGEAGLVKSSELRTEEERLRAAGSNVYLCDLASTADRSEIRDMLPELQPGEPATLLIDAFDEVTDDVSDIADLLGNYIRRIDSSSLILRIASRPVVWSTRLEQQLDEMWAGGLAVLTLEAITVDDVRAAADAELSGEAADEFMRTVRDRDLWSLAASPITLSFLLRRFRARGITDVDRLSIHRHGITDLVSEANERRVDRGRSGLRRCSALLPPSAAQDAFEVVSEVARVVVDAGDYDYFVDRLAASYAADPTLAIEDHWAISAADVAFRDLSAERLEDVAEAAKARQPMMASLIEAQWGALWRSRRAEALDRQATWEAQRDAKRAEALFSVVRLDAAIGARSWEAAAQELRRHLDDDGERTMHHDLEQPLSRLPAWLTLDDHQRGVIVDLGRLVVEDAPVTESTMTSIADAITLVADVNPDELDAVDGARWQELVQPLANGAGRFATCALVVERAAAHDRTAVDRTLLNVLRSQVEQDYPRVLDFIGDYRPDGWGRLLLGLAADDDVDGRVCGQLLGAAFEVEVAGVQQVALSIAADRPAKPPSRTAFLDHEDGSAEAAHGRRAGRERSLPVRCSLPHQRRRRTALTS